jgi:hypothetical protein
MKRRHLIPVLCLFYVPLSAQFNLSAGYSFSFMDAPTHDAIIEAHQSSLEESYNERLNTLDILHGLDLGFEYRWESVAIEAGWRIKRNRQEGSGALSGVPFSNKLRHSNGSFYTGLVQYFGWLRLAATVDYNYVRNHVEFEEPNIETVFKTDSWGSHFSLGAVLKGSGSVSLVLAPFIQKSWTDFDLAPLREALTGETNGPVREGYLIYGITIMFLNGPR